ncbi:hypothetical protein [Streptomyces sp. NPDC058694]|uniref:hypothetical protein n=1 Tax=Streptomyces sp. NPDC058694 TaxID=3346603 RepID=UPI003662E4F9
MYEYVSHPDHRRSDRDRLVRRLRRTDDTTASAAATATAFAFAGTTTSTSASVELEWRLTPSPTPDAIRGEL